MRPGLGRELELSDLRVQQVFVGRLGWTTEQLGAVDDLQYAVLVGAIAEIHAIAGGAGGNRAVQLLRGRSGRIRLLPREAEVADEYRMVRIAQVVDLRHPPRSPRRQAGNEIGDARIAFPEVLVRALEAADLAQAPGGTWVGHIPHFVRGIAEHAQHVELVRIALGQSSAGADAYHLRPAAFVEAFLAGDVVQIPWRLGVGDVDDRGPVEFSLAREWVHRLGYCRRAAVVSDIGDPAAILVLYHRLVGAPRLKVVEANELDVFRFRAMLREYGGRDRCERDCAHQCGQFFKHGLPPGELGGWWRRRRHFTVGESPPAPVALRLAATTPAAMNSAISASS